MTQSKSTCSVVFVHMVDYSHEGHVAADYPISSQYYSNRGLKCASRMENEAQVHSSGEVVGLTENGLQDGELMEKWGDDFL